MKDEIERRETFTAAVLAYFKARPNVWIDARDLMELGGLMAWRSRISDARRIIEAEGGRLENQQHRVFSRTVISEYRYTPFTPLGRDAGERIDQKSLFELR